MEVSLFIRIRFLIMGLMSYNFLSRANVERYNPRLPNWQIHRLIYKEEAHVC